MVAIKQLAKVFCRCFGYAVNIFGNGLYCFGYPDKSLPASGVIFPSPANADNFLVLTASYKDKGFGNSIPLTGSDYVSLRGNIFTAKQFTNITGLLPWTEG